MTTFDYSKLTLDEFSDALNLHIRLRKPPMQPEDVGRAFEFALRCADDVSTLRVVDFPDVIEAFYIGLADYIEANA